MVNRKFISIPTDVINVQDYGAVGDGIADDTAALQSAIDACRRTVNIRAKTCYIPSGVYKISAPLNVYSRLNIIGDGSYNSQINADHTNGPILNLDDLNDNVLYNVNLKGLRLTYSSVPSSGRDTYTDAVCIKINKLCAHFVWEDIYASGGYAGLLSTASFFDATLTNIFFQFCYIGADLTAGYSTTLDGHFVIYQCFKGFKIAGLYYSDLSFAFESCGFTDATVSTYNTDATVMPIALEISNSYGVNIKHFGEENTNSILLRTSYFTGSVSGWFGGTVAATQWTEDAARTSVPLAQQAIISLNNTTLTFNDFRIRMLVSEGFNSAATNNSALFYFGELGAADSGIHFSGSPIIECDAYYFSKESDVLYLTHDNPSQPILGMQHPRVTFDSASLMGPVVPYGSFNTSSLSSNYQQIFSASEPLTGAITSSYSFNTVYLPKSPRDFKVKLLKNTNFSVSSVVASGTDTITPASLTSIPITSDGDYWLLEKTTSTKWSLLDGRDTGVYNSGTWTRQADGQAWYRVPSFSVLGSGTVIQGSGNLPFSFSSTPVYNSDLVGISDESERITGAARTYGTTSSFFCRGVSTSGTSFFSPTQLTFSVTAAGNWY